MEGERFVRGRGPANGHGERPYKSRFFRRINVGGRLRRKKLNSGGVAVKRGGHRHSGEDNQGRGGEVSVV